MDVSVEGVWGSWVKGFYRDPVAGNILVCTTHQRIWGWAGFSTRPEVFLVSLTVALIVGYITFIDRILAHVLPASVCGDITMLRQLVHWSDSPLGLHIDQFPL